MNRLVTAAVAALSALALVGIVVLTVLDRSVPELLGYVLTTGLAGLVGALLPKAPTAPADQGDDSPPPAGLASHLVRTDTGKALHARSAA